MDDRRYASTGIVAGLLLSAVAFALSPLLMPPSYSWVAHTLSQAASQGQDGAWLSRVGFLIAGLTILRLTSSDIVDWEPVARNVHRVTGVAMLGAIAFTDRSWNPDAPFDPVENAVHSAVATIVAITFMGGVLLVIRQKQLAGNLYPWMDLLVVAISVMMPPMMLVLPGWTGVIERVMFGTAYVWYASELYRLNFQGADARAPLTAERVRDAFGQVMPRRVPGFNRIDGD